MGAHIAALGDRTGSRKTLCNEDTALLTQIVIGILGRLGRFGIIIVHLAITQFGVIEKVLLSTLTSRLRHTRNRLTLFLGVLNLLEHHLHQFRILMQVVIQLLLNEVTNELIDRQTTLW